MEPDDWTPARGWIMALTRLGVGAAITSAVSFGVLAALRLIAPYFQPPGGILMSAVLTLAVLISSVVGYPLGYGIVSGLCDKCGLAGTPLLVPATTLFIGAQLLAFHILAAIWGNQNLFMMTFSAGIGLWSLVAVFKILLLE